MAALSTTYNAVASRAREIATLRAMGFGAAPVVTSVLVEAIVLGIVGGLLGGLLAYLLLNGVRSSTLNFQNFSQITYAFTVTPPIVMTGIIYGLILTLLGGLVPGLARCAHSDYIRAAAVLGVCAALGDRPAIGVPGEQRVARAAAEKHNKLCPAGSLVDIDPDRQIAIGARGLVSHVEKQALQAGVKFRWQRTSGRAYPRVSRANPLMLVDAAVASLQRNFCTSASAVLSLPSALRSACSRSACKARAP